VSSRFSPFRSREETMQVTSSSFSRRTTGWKELSSEVSYFSYGLSALRSSILVSRSPFLIRRAHLELLYAKTCCSCFVFFGVFRTFIQKALSFGSWPFPFSSCVPDSCSIFVICLRHTVQFAEVSRPFCGPVQGGLSGRPLLLKVFRSPSFDAGHAPSPAPRAASFIRLGGVNLSTLFFHSSAWTLASVSGRSPHATPCVFAPENVCPLSVFSPIPARRLSSVVVKALPPESLLHSYAATILYLVLLLPGAQRGRSFMTLVSVRWDQAKPFFGVFTPVTPPKYSFSLDSAGSCKIYFLFGGRCSRMSRALFLPSVPAEVIPRLFRLFFPYTRRMSN